ncbi:hypothetical protein STEG23_015185 [Scotinomys teguina]
MEGHVLPLHGQRAKSQYGQTMQAKNSSMPPNQWRLTSSWTKPRPEASLTNGASSSSLNEYGPKAIDQYPLPMPKTPSAHPQEMWHFSSQERPDFLGPAYSRAFPDRHLAPEVYPDGRRGSFLHLLQQDRYLNRPLEPATRENCNPTKIAGSTGLLTNLPPNSDHCKEMLIDTCKVTVVDNKKIYGHGSATPSLGNESPKGRKPTDHSRNIRNCDHVLGCFVAVSDGKETYLQICICFADFSQGGGANPYDLLNSLAKP